MKHTSRSELDYDPERETMIPAAKQIYLQQVRGPMAIGNCLFLLLDGAVLLFATFIWYRRRKSLSGRNRINFHLLIFLNLVCVAFSIEDIYHLMAYNARTSEDLRTNTIPESLQMLWGAIIAVIVQCFLIKRTGYFLDTHKYITKLLYGGSILSFLGAAFVTIEIFLTDRSIGPFPLLLAANQTWLWLTAMTDVAISSVLAWKISSMKSGFRVETDELIERVVRITIGSAAPIALFASFAAIAYAATFRTGLYTLFYVFALPLPALYTLSFLYAISGYSTDVEGSTAARPAKYDLRPVTVERQNPNAGTYKSPSEHQKPRNASGLMVELPHLLRTGPKDDISMLEADESDESTSGDEEKAV